MEDVRAEAAVAVASTLADKVHQERKSNAAKIVKYPPPPPFIRAVLLVQAFVRRRAFLRSFGGVGAGDNVDEEILELAPPKPMMSIALNFVRRLKSFRWVNIEREATLVAGLVDAQAANITMRDVSAVVNYYQDKVPSDHLSLNVLQEALDRQVIVAKEALQERASKLTSPAAIVEAMEQVITDFQVPPEREDRVLDQTRIRLKRIVAEAEETIRKMLAESSSTPSIDAVAARFKRDFGPVASVVEEELKVARIRRVQFLEMELETRWSRPFAGPLPPHSRAARRYELELGKKNPKVIAFVTEEARHAATLEADFEVELSDLRAKVRDLTQKRMEARARSLIQDFDEKLADAAAQVQEVIDRAILNIGPENPKVIKRAKELLSPDAHSTLFALQAEHTADQLRAELAVADPSPEAGDRRRGCAMALAALLGQLNRDHPLQAKLRAEFAQDLSEIAGTGAAREARDETAPPLPPPDEGPGEVTPPPVTDTEKPGAGESEGPTGPTDLELAIQMDEDPFKLEPTPEETNQALFEAGVRQYDDDPNLDLPDEEQDLWGAPKGFSELTSINHEVLDSARKADFEDDKAKLSFDPDPANVLLMSSIAAEDLSPEMRKKRFEQEKAERARGEQKERTAVLTARLEELTMETVKLHTEEVFKLKFVRSIAEALQIPKHRVKVNGFERGSVKVLLSILEPTGEEDEEGRNTMSADRALQELAEQVEDPNSRLRLGEVGPFVVAAHLDRDVIKSDQVKVGSMADAYLASHLEGEDYELPGQAGSWTAESASVHDSDEADPDQLIKKAHATVGTRWGSSRMEHGSLQAESHFRSTCPHSKEDGTLAAWAIPYEKQPMYTFYEKNSEEAAKEPIIRLPEEKRKVTMTASFHLTRHPASGTDVLKGKIPPAGGVKAYAADTWLDKEHLGMKDPTLRPGDADLQETIKKKAAKAEPLAEFEEPATPAAGGLAGVGGAATVAVPRPTSAASKASRSEASDASESKKKKKGKKKGKEEQQSSTEQSASATLSAESSKMEAEASHAKTDSMTEADAESEAGKKEKPKKKGKKKTGSGEGAEEMGQTGESFHSMASATSAASQASALTDESEADSPKAKKKPKAKPSAKKEAQPSKLEIPKEGGETGSRKGSDVTASDTEVVVPKAGGSSPKPTDSGRPSPKKDRSRSPKPEGPDLGGKEVQNLEGLGANFATQFCWAGMYGGMSGTGLRPRWKDNPRLPALVGKQSTDDLHTPCYVRHAYRVGTVAVGPPYQLREKMDAMSPAWSALRVLDLSIEKADWVRSYSKILKEHSRKLGPAQGIREMNRTVSLPKVGASRPKPRPVLRARSAEAKKDRRTSPGKDTSVERRETERLDVDSTRRIDVDPKRKDTKEDKKKKDKDKDKKKKEKKDKKGEEDEDGKKKKKDKKKKDKKDKHQSEAEEEEPEVEEPIEAPESFETMPSVGTWLMSFTEDMLLRPVSVESPTSVAESLYSATFGVEASVADALLSAAFGQLTPEAVEDLTDEIIAEQADQETEATTLEMARAAVHQTLQHAAIILAQQEASQSSNAICARAAVALAIQRAAEILSRKEDELPVLVPEEAPPSVETIIHIQPEEAVELVEPQAEVVESDGSEVETEPEVRFPVKRTPFTNSGATRREVSNFALSLTSSIFRASKLAPGQRHASRSRSPLPVAELSATVPPVPPARAQQEASFAASFVPLQRDPGRQSPPPRPPPTEPSPRPDRGPKPKLTAVPANEGERF